MPLRVSGSCKTMVGGRLAGSTAFLRSQTSADSLSLTIILSPPFPCLSQPFCRLQDCQELTDVERAIEIVINNFHCYAVKGRKECLTPNELKELVGQRLPHLSKGVGTLDEKIECLGDNDEAKLQFGEYWDIMGDAAKGCRVPGQKK
ncbi:protein S100-A14-like [Varanus komodoensis]|uniref:protein S100-A14-like n=1 Tax=Varanus komodoensis TaxID=61221 RepID=UPI001CF7A11D|nr:protein S100-A14-like [Varanus komodoensis]